jgi:hypothetical protein
MFDVYPVLSSAFVTSVKVNVFGVKSSNLVVIIKFPVLSQYVKVIILDVLYVLFHVACNWIVSPRFARPVVPVQDPQLIR